MLISLYPIVLSFSSFGVTTISTGISFLWLTCLQFFCCCCCFDLFLFCFVWFVFIYLFFLAGGVGVRIPVHFTHNRLQDFSVLWKKFSFQLRTFVVCDPPPPPNQELHLVLMLPYKYRLFNYFNYSKKLQRFMQDTYDTTSYLSFCFLLNIRCCTQSICLKSIWSFRKRQRNIGPA